MVRVGTINLEDPSTVSNLFDIPKGEVQSLQLCGHLAIKVDYRIVTTRQSSGSRPTEAGPKPRIVAAPTMLKGVAPVGSPPLRADVGEAIDSEMASSMSSLSLGVSTGSAGNRK